MSSLKHDNIKFLGATSEAVQKARLFPSWPPLLKESLAPMHVNVIIQMTEATFVGVPFLQFVADDYIFKFDLPLGA